MLSRGAARRVVRGVVVGVALLVIVAGSLVLHGRSLATGARINAATRVAAVGVDDQGYWFVRIEVQNTGNLPWYGVFVSSPRLVGKVAPAVEVGSTLPYGTIPDRFDFVIETVAEGVVPEAPELITFDLGVISAEPWYLSSRKVGQWPNELSL